MAESIQRKPKGKEEEEGERKPRVSDHLGKLRDKTKPFIPSSKLSQRRWPGSRRLWRRSARCCQHLLTVNHGPDCVHYCIWFVHPLCQMGLFHPLHSCSFIHSLLNLLWRDNNGLQTACPPEAYFLAQMEKLAHRSALLSPGCRVLWVAEPATKHTRWGASHLPKRTALGMDERSPASTV